VIRGHISGTDRGKSGEIPARTGRCNQGAFLSQSIVQNLHEKADIKCADMKSENLPESEMSFPV